MKRSILTLCLALCGLASYAQKGTKAVGLNFLYGTEISNIGFGAKAQYNFTDGLRTELGFDYFLKKDYTKLWQINLNFHYIFPVADKFKAYPIAGISYMHWGYDFGDLGNPGDSGDDSFDYGEYGSQNDEDDSSSSLSRVGVNLGAGVQYDISNSWGVNFEFKYQLVKDFNQALFSLGAVYKF